MVATWAEIHGVYGFLGDQLYKGMVDAVFSSGVGGYLVADYLSEDTFQIMKTKLRREHFFETFLENMLESVVARGMYDRRLKMVCNAGALDPLGCARKLANHLQGLGIPLRVAAVTGDNLTDRLDELGELRHISSGEPMPGKYRRRLTSVSAYIGAKEATQALAEGADIVVAGRMTDAGLALACAAHAHGWSYGGDVHRLAAGVLAGQLLSCGGQCVRPVELAGSDPAAVGGLIYPTAWVSEEGRIRVSSPSGATRESVLSHLFYGISQREFIDPDVTVDLGDVEVESLSLAEVEVRGVRGLPRPEKLRVLILCSGDSVTLKGMLQVPLSDFRALGTDGFRRLIGARLRGGGSLVADEGIDVEHLGDTHRTSSIFLSIRFGQKVYAKIGRGQLPSLLVSGINGGYAGMPRIEHETIIWDALVARSLVEPHLQVAHMTEDLGDPTDLRSQGGNR